MPEGKSSKSSKEAKLYVIDTNVILDNANFENELSGIIVIPDIVLKELDKHKHGFSENAVNARTFARKLDQNFDNYRIARTKDNIEINDLKIIDIAKGMHESDLDVTLITNDMYMSSIARCVGVKVLKQKDIEQPIEIYGGISEEDPELPNQYQVTKSGLYKLKNGKKKRLEKDKKIFGIQHKNVEQRCLIDALLDDDVKLVTVVGDAGTGKTLLSVACGLQKVIEEKTRYEIDSDFCYFGCREIFKIFF